MAFFTKEFGEYHNCNRRPIDSKVLLPENINVTVSPFGFVTKNWLKNWQIRVHNRSKWNLNSNGIFLQRSSGNTRTATEDQLTGKYFQQGVPNEEQLQDTFKHPECSEYSECILMDQTHIAHWAMLREYQSKTFFQKWFLASTEKWMALHC